MRGRPKRKRCISFVPEITYFKPAGVPLRELQGEILTLDEVEALRLTDIENLDQETASKKMGIARITYLNVIHSAHEKVARALIYGKSIQMKGGDIIMPNLDGTGPQGQGPMTGRGLGRGAGRGMGRGRNAQGPRAGGSAECTCPSCGEKIAHTRGVPCSQTKCPKCDTPMRGVFCS
ncbi:MAG: DUF134 domain-containing protein [Candidatus Berkelbacteria bacterium]|nr:DUF134 domain-containing protein [Candidatus Berkelbacteria bacterium]